LPAARECENIPFIAVVKAPSFDDTVPDAEGELSSSVQRGPRSEGALTVLRGPNEGALFFVESSGVVIGRSPDVEVPIPDDTLSRQHARITRIGNVFAIEDMGSTNGTSVDGEPTDGVSPLEDGSRIHLGKRTVLHFRLHDRVEMETVQQTQDQVQRDALTGLFNRRHLQQRFWSEVAFSQRHGSSLSLLLLDVDRFKQINDGFGHPAGDAVLRLLAEELTELTREEDVIARYGGEEFALVARGISLAQTMQLAERIREAMATKRVPVEGAEGAEVTFTVSIGVAHTSGEDVPTPQEMFASADRALYASKDGGRNQISLAPPGIG